MISFFTRLSTSFDNVLAAGVGPVECLPFCLVGVFVEVDEFAAMIEESSGSGVTADFSNDTFLNHLKSYTMFDVIIIYLLISQLIIRLHFYRVVTIWKSNIPIIRFITSLHFLHD